jgi:hypothetical protein
VGPSYQGEESIFFFARNKEALPCVRRCIVGPSCQGEESIFLRVIRRHFLACEDVWWVPTIRGRKHFFHVIRRHFLACDHGPHGSQLSASPRTVLFRWLSFVDHVDDTVPSAARRWTTERPRKGTTRSRGRKGSGCPSGGKYEGLLVQLRCEAAVGRE